jgi:hypothetical protein
MITENTLNDPKSRISAKDFLHDLTPIQRYNRMRMKLQSTGLVVKQPTNNDEHQHYALIQTEDISHIPIAYSRFGGQVRVNNFDVKKYDSPIDWWGRNILLAHTTQKDLIELVKNGDRQSAKVLMPRSWNVAAKSHDVGIYGEKNIGNGYETRNLICGFKDGSSPETIHIPLDYYGASNTMIGTISARYDRLRRSILVQRKTDSNGEYYYVCEDGILFHSIADTKVVSGGQYDDKPFKQNCLNNILPKPASFDIISLTSTKPSVKQLKNGSNKKPYVKQLSANWGNSLKGAVLVACQCCKGVGRTSGNIYNKGSACEYCNATGLSFISEKQFSALPDSKNNSVVETDVETRHAHPEIAALQDALDMGTVPNRSIGFAQSLVSQFLANGKLSSSQMYYVKELNTPQASRGGNPKIDALKKVHESLTGRDKNFAIDLIGSWNKYGRLSDKQMYWVGELTKKGIATSPDVTKVQDGWDAVVELFNQFEGSENGKPLKHPIITLVVESNTKEAPAPCVPKYGTKGVETFDAFQRELVIRPLNFFDKKTRTTEAAELQFTEAERASSQDSRRFIQTGATLARGNVNRFNGTMTPSMGLPDDTWIVLQSLRADPISTIRRLGRKSGYCCFCSKHLSTDVSMTHGYGATCAKNAGLPYGKKSAALIEKEIENEVSRVVMQLEGGSWAVVCLETNSVIMTFDNKDQAENWLDEDTKVSFQNKAGELVE